MASATEAGPVVLLLGDIGDPAEEATVLNPIISYGLDNPDKSCLSPETRMRIEGGSTNESSVSFQL